MLKLLLPRLSVPIPVVAVAVVDPGIIEAVVMLAFTLALGFLPDLLLPFPLALVGLEKQSRQFVHLLG